LFRDHPHNCSADQWTEPHSHRQNAARLNGVKYLDSHAQVLIERTGAPHNLWFIAQDYFAHVHNLGANCHFNWKIPEQVSRGKHLLYVERTIAIYDLF
jgi:hypothetical protein